MNTAKLAALNADLQTWSIVWLIAALFVIVRHWRYGRGVGLLLAYVISLATIHWLGAVIYLLPWYTQKGGELVAEGMKQSAFAILALAAGMEFTRLLMKPREVSVDAPEPSTVDPVVVNLYLVTGVVMYAVMIPMAARIATLRALVSTGSTVAVVGLALKCWNAWQEKRARVMGAWLALSAMLPFVTVTTQGYLGYGMGAMATVCAFVASYYGPRWKTLVVGVVLAFVGLSVFVTYMRDRSDIRASIWAGSAFGDRAGRVGDTLAHFEWFNPYDSAHLYRIDDRLNQDFLVGASVSFLGSGAVPFAHGSTVTDAVLAIVPRAMWSSKDIVSGSGDLVSTYTGIKFMQDTSVGIGQVMECYVNFGTAGVVIGFLIIGAALTWVDLSAFRAVASGDVRRFTLWYLPGLGLLQVGGSFVDVTSVAAAGFGVAVILNYITTHFVGRKRLPDRDITLSAAASGPPEVQP